MRTARTINYHVDLTTLAPTGVFRCRLNPATDERGLYAIRAAWSGLDVPHELYGSFALANTPFGRALVRMDSRSCGMTFEFLQVASDEDTVGTDVLGASGATGERRFYA